MHGVQAFQAASAKLYEKMTLPQIRKMTVPQIKHLLIAKGRCFGHTSGRKPDLIALLLEPDVGADDAEPAAAEPAAGSGKRQRRAPRK